ncbi:MAG: exodeoxyribonuclease V subunit alpha [Deltaproteobacteria bacterium]|nr:exodeoxyribonuclease V subunit alpha [Deltaproteobacteria bacterium]
MTAETLKKMAQLKTLRDLDRHFARWVGVLSGDVSEPLTLAAALASQRLGEGDVCVDLGRFAGRRLFADPETQDGLPAPGLESWIEVLGASAAVGTPETPERPLILDGTRLYLARYWHFEKTLADGLHRLASASIPVDLERIEAALNRLFPRAPGEQDDQKTAAALAALRRLCIVSGGPGTGKTHTVAVILALIAELAGPPFPRMVLAAPTGKAAARLTEAIRKAREQLPAAAEVRSAIPTEAMTLHRLIQVRPGRANPGHGPDNPLHLDLLVIDEASMIDLPLMSRTVAALPEHARLILLGDKDQLASVEAGNVFADLCAKPGRGYSPALCAQLKRCAAYDGPADPTATALDDCLALLEKSYRFGPHSGIGALARTVRAGADPVPVFDTGAEDVTHVAPDPAGPPRTPEAAVDAFGAIFKAADPAQALARLENFAILCATRDGAAGVVGSNSRVEMGLKATGLPVEPGGMYRGRPILVTRNDYRLGVFNGDIGILWPDPIDGVLRAWFRQADGELKSISPGRLPAHETAFAMTVHKAQGSEFDRVLLLLPDRDVRVLSRELIYTAVTRARHHIEIRGDTGLIRKATARTADRASGLAKRLWQTTG